MTPLRIQGTKCARAAIALAIFFCILFALRKDPTPSGGMGAPVENSKLNPLLAPLPALGDREPSRVTLTGASAREHLKSTGLYDSLTFAFAEARYAVEKLDPAAQHARGADFFVNNPAQKLRAWFSQNGVELASGRGANQKQEPWSLRMHLKASGRAGALLDRGPRTVQAEGSRIEIADPQSGVTEWFKNKADGLEQWFTLEQAPAGGSGSLRLLLEVEGTLRPEIAPCRPDQDVRMQTEVRLVERGGGNEILRYCKLKAWDVTGRMLPARMEVLQSSAIALIIDDSAARYPLTIDPLFVNMEARLIEEEVEGQFLGASVALSGDTAIIGCPYAHTEAGEHAGSVYVFVRTGGIWNLQAKLNPSDAAQGAGFGSAVALSGDVALVGSPYHNPGGIGGSAYLFERRGAIWSLSAQLSASDAQSGDLFGFSVALDGGTALVGAIHNHSETGVTAGSAYLFGRNENGWSQQARLTANDGEENDFFGASVALSNQTALVGAIYSHNINQTATGSAYVFVRNNLKWKQQAKLNSIDPASGVAFGACVALDGDTALIGAPYPQPGAGPHFGAAYLFERTGTIWTQKASFAAGEEYDHFGASVALSGGTLLVGAPWDASAYLFAKDATGWNQLARLTAVTPGLSEFGASVALDGAIALIGAPRDGAPGAEEGGIGSNVGSASLFVRSGDIWTRQQKLVVGDKIEEDHFGTAVALSGGRALIGAPWDTTAIGLATGSAYLFVHNGTTWTPQAKLTADDGVTGASFGAAVALSGTAALVGAPGAKSALNSPGSAYLFGNSGTNWNQQQKLVAANAAGDDRFGFSVSLSGATALVGAPGNELAATHPGSAYVFIHNGARWIQNARLIPQNGTDYSLFGSSTALENGTALIGAPGSAVSGKAYIFARNEDGWTQQAQLAGTEPAYSFHDRFGSSVALGGATALVGAPCDNSSGPVGGGRAYLYAKAGANWEMQAKLTSNDANPDGEFGRSVALCEKRALVGDPGADTLIGANTGSAYLFVLNDLRWTQEAKFTAGIDSSRNDKFGGSVALENNIAMAGAAEDDTAASDAGSAYSFLLGELPRITQQPLSRTVFPGAQVTFSVTAEGYGPLRYQWRKDGIEIADAGGSNAASPFTATYSIPSAHFSYSGTYDVMISNIGGTATSAAAILNVNALSQLERALPSTPPEANGFLLVTLSPPGKGAAWRFVGEQQWRASGVPVGGLTTSDREVEFRPTAGYLQPLREKVSIISGAAATLLEREYYGSEDEATGGILIQIQPASLTFPNLPTEARGQWRILGNGAEWQESGAAITGLYAGNYLVELKPVAGRATPSALSVTVEAGKTPTATATYYLADAAIGALPQLLSFDTVNGSANAQSGLPYPFVGQLRSHAGAATGFVVKSRVVATAAHVIFNNDSLTAVIGLQWLLERDHASYEPAPLIPRGFYTFEGYSAQRTADGTPGQSSPASQDLDAAAVYFGEDAGRNGFSGFIASDAEDNEWLLSSRSKMLVGYPLHGITAANQGRMHATTAANVKFSKAFGRTFTTLDITSTGGNSGGPLCVQYDDGVYYPAAIYLGGSAQTVVRAIDSQIIELFSRAEISASGGPNNTEGGYTRTDPGADDGPLPFSSLTVTLSPSGAVGAGARWRLGPNGTPRASGDRLLSLNPGNYTIFFIAPSGYATPAPKAIDLSAPIAQTVTAEYSLASKPPVIASPPSASGTHGEPFNYQITATGDGISFGVTGELPAGLNFDNSTRLISGLPQESGIFHIELRAFNLAGSDKLSVTIRIAPALRNQAVAVSRAQELSYKIVTTDLVDTYWADPKSLPPGLAWNGATGIIAGTPLLSGSFEIPISVTNDGGTTNAILTLKVRPVPEGINEKSYSIGQSIKPFLVSSPDIVTRFEATNLPPGLSIDPQSGFISGTPSASGVFNATITATNDGGSGATSLRFVIEAILRVKATGSGHIPDEYSGDTIQLSGAPISIRAQASTGHFFAGWSGGETSSEEKLHFIMRDGLELEAHFVPFSEVRGTYAGLLIGEPATPASTGSITLAVSPGGFVTGALAINGKSYSLSKGQFLPAGRFEGRFARRGEAPFSVTLRLKALSGAPQISATFTTKGSDFELVADRAAPHTRQSPAAQKGSYTVNLTLPSNSEAALGHGYGVLRVSNSGAVRFVGILGDGTPVTQSAFISSSGTWPVYVPLAAGKGVVAGEVRFRARATLSDLDGSLAWIPSAAAGRFDVAVLGSSYHAPAIDYPKARLILGGGALSAQSRTVALTFDLSRRQLAHSGPERVTLTLTPATGLFRGSYRPEGAAKPIFFSGALLQKSRTGAGLLKNAGGGMGYVELGAAP